MDEEARAATPEERRWFKRLERCLKDMPETVEIQVHQRYIQMNEAGGAAAAFADPDGLGHADDVSELMNFETERVLPCSESI